MPELKTFEVRLVHPRATFPGDMTPEEQKLMSVHAGFIRDLIARKIIILAGPHCDPTFGMVILRAESREHALAIMGEDLTVKAGMMNLEISDFLVPLPLFWHYIPRERYVTNPTNKALYKKTTIPAPVDEVFRAWTTEEGIKSFFAPLCKVELRIGGPFEVYFSGEENAPYRGSEDCHILSFVPNRMFSFEWNAPKDHGKRRFVYTQVVIFFHEKSGETEIEFIHSGWGDGQDWELTYNYFDRAWDFVLGNLKKRFTDGPIDWAKR